MGTNYIILYKEVGFLVMFWLKNEFLIKIFCNFLLKILIIFYVNLC
jgi:hypothetical protein